MTAPLSLQREQDALQFIKLHQTAVLGTLSPEGELHGATITYACNDEFTFYFATRKNSRKARDLAANPRLSLTIGVDPDEPGTIQAQGTARLVEDGLLGPFSQIIDAVSGNWPPFRQSGLEFGFYEITITWMRWSDFKPQGNTDNYSTISTIIPRETQ